MRRQLEAIRNQTRKPTHLVVFQNEEHVDISDLKKEFDFIHVKNDHNTKFFGRFAACFTFDVDVCIVMDDDLIPGRMCLENYVTECVSNNAIMGGNGRFSYSSKKTCSRSDGSLLDKNELVDYVGHVWCFKKDWLYYMFGTKPSTYATGEDMHLCYSSKIKGGIESFICKKRSPEESPYALGSFSGDKFASYPNTPPERYEIENYFRKSHGLITL